MLTFQRVLFYEKLIRIITKCLQSFSRNARQTRTFRREETLHRRTMNSIEIWFDFPAEHDGNNIAREKLKDPHLMRDETC